MREFRELSVGLIDESNNIRRSFSDERLQELAASIREYGILKPILVRPNGDRFTLIDGWRRLSAAKSIDQSTVPVRIRNIDENAAEEEMIIANLHHEDVTPLDEAMSYQRLLDKGQEIVYLLDHQHDLPEFLNQKVQAAIIHKNPYFKPFDLRAGA